MLRVVELAFVPASALIFASDHTFAFAFVFGFSFEFTFTLTLEFRPISSTREITHSWGYQHGETHRGKTFVPMRLNVSRETNDADKPDDEEVCGVIEVEEVFKGISSAPAITR